MIDDYEDEQTYALVWETPEGHLCYWSVTEGWTYNVDRAWTLSGLEVDNIEDDERLLSKLPQHSERKAGADWQPVGRRYDPTSLWS